MGKIDRIRPSLGATFGHDLGQRVVGASDRQPKKHHENESEAQSEDALELHEDNVIVTNQMAPIIPLDHEEHLDLSA